MMQWLGTNRCLWHFETCEMIAWNMRHIELLNWMRGNGGPETYNDDSEDEEENEVSEDDKDESE